MDTFDIIVRFHCVLLDNGFDMTFSNRKLEEVLPFLTKNGFSHLERKDNTFIVYVNI